MGVMKGGGFSPNPISWIEIRSYRKENKLKKFSRWALNLLHVADGIYLEWVIEEMKKK